MVPGSTLMYGSSLTIATLRPRASRIAPSEAAAMPLPNEDTTPPVTKTKRVITISRGFPSREPSRNGYMTTGGQVPTTGPWLRPHDARPNGHAERRPDELHSRLPP